MLQIVCVQSGNYQERGAEYVNILHDSVRRNLSRDTEGKFVCFTDDPTGLDEGIEVRPLPGDIDGWYNKLWLFSPGLFPDGDRIVYFDLDTLVIGSLDHLVHYRGAFTLLRDVYRPGGLQSSVMLWEAGTHTDIWTEWDKTRPIMELGDQAWIEQRVVGIIPLQTLFPGLFVSFKEHCKPYPPAGAKVVVFHGEPRPHGCGGWVKEVWKRGGLGSVDLEMICNTENDKLKSNCKASMALGLRQVTQKSAHSYSVCIVGGGPSLKRHIDIIKLRQKAGQRIWALNGSAKLLNDHGIEPDALWIVDARPENANFIINSDSYNYYISSQCAPETFDEAGPDAVIWHDANCGEWLPEGVTLIGGGTTVGMKAIAGAFVLGYRKIHLFGYDSSLKDNEHHAYPQSMNDEDLIVDAWCDGRKFRAAPWMAQQAKDFEALAIELAEMGCEIHVYGDGLLPHLAKLMQRASENIPAYKVRAHEILTRLPKGPVKGAEIGVFTGALSATLLGRPDLSLIMVDSWAANGEDYIGDSGDFHAGLTQEAQDGYFDLTRRHTEFAGSRAEVIRKSSREAANDVPDCSLDFVFIDADHSYSGCMADIAAWKPKLKPGGLLSGHDYDNPDFEKFGVKRAVDELGLETELGDNLTWFIRLPTT
jgi:hypothetical protein